MDLSGDGGVLKTVLRAAKDGAAQPSEEFPIADVHYEGKLEETGEVFDSSRVDGAVFSFEVGKGRVIRGWDIAVKTMKVGEVAQVRCSAEYAYGSKGAPPEIPPNATLVFEVELVAVRAPKVGGRGAESAHARLEEARRQREEAAAKREDEKKKREEAKAAAEARIKAKQDAKKGGGKGGKSKK